MNQPRTPIDCPYCLYLGQCGQFDLYYCPRNKPHQPDYRENYESSREERKRAGILCLNANTADRRVSMYCDLDCWFSEGEWTVAIHLACQRYFIPKDIADKLCFPRHSRPLTPEQLASLY